MAKNKLSAKSVSTALSEPCFTVDRIEPVTNACLKIIKSILNTEKIGFANSAATDNRRKWVLVGQDSSSAFSRETYKVQSFLETSSRSYWLAVTLFFQSPPNTKKHLLESVSLLIFEGIRSDEEKTAILRAEWDCYGNDSIKHAQPHWHVYSAASNTTFTEPLGFGQQSATQTFPPSSETSVQDGDADLWEANKFHFAMASKWHIDEKCSMQEKLSDQNSLIKWLAGCLNYTKEQLEYLS